jgi:hypothetical protein
MQLAKPSHMLRQQRHHPASQHSEPHVHANDHQQLMRAGDVMDLMIATYHAFEADASNSALISTHPTPA